MVGVAGLATIHAKPLEELQHETLGIYLTGRAIGDGTVFAFRGIPYGTIGNRWTRSIPFAHQPGSVLDATKFGTKDFGPLIAFPAVPENDLNCLNLNVYRPAHVSERLHPVMVWIHGGSLCVGAGSDPIWDPAKLVQESVRLGKPIVAVSLNYRLGPFGFLAPKDPIDRAVERGNFGFHDQYLALQWVQQHILGFNGDPHQVTIGGESAGGCSVHAQIARQALAADKLFSRAILQSGTLAVMGFADSCAMDELWDRAVCAAGIVTSENALELMRGMRAEEILSNPALQLDGYPVYLDNIFVAGPLISGEGLFEAHPHCIDAILHGDNAHEGNVFRDVAKRPGALDRLQQAATKLLGIEGCAKIQDLYGLSPDLSHRDLSWRLHQFPEDRAWPSSAFYHLSATSPFSTSPWPEESFHTLDLLYVFGNFDHLLAEQNKTSHLRVGLEMRNAWLRFVWGLDPWERSFDGVAMEFGVTRMQPHSFEQCRRWSAKRSRRLEAMRAMGVVNVTRLCTLLYP